MNIVDKTENDQRDEEDDIKPVLISFLDKLKNQLLENKMSDKEEEVVGKFFMEYNCRNKLFDDNIISEGTTREEIMKYLFLGYYIYNNIIDKQ